MMKNILTRLTRGAKGIKEIRRTRRWNKPSFFYNCQPRCAKDEMWEKRFKCEKKTWKPGDEEVAAYYNIWGEGDESMWLEELSSSSRQEEEGARPRVFLSFRACLWCAGLSQHMKCDNPEAPEPAPEGCSWCTTLTDSWKLKRRKGDITHECFSSFAQWSCCVDKPIVFVIGLREKKREKHGVADSSLHEIFLSTLPGRVHVPLFMHQTDNPRRAPSQTPARLIAL